MHDILEYSYTDGDKVEVDGKVLHAILLYLKQVEQQHTTVGYSHSYSKSPKEVKAEDGKTIVHIDLSYVNYPSFNSYMNQQANKFTDMIGNMAMDFFNTLASEHLKNIESGKAKKLGTLKTEQEDGTLKLA